ncbi:MAG: sensor histidine kinase, partial [Chitinophagaceae bacterium]
DIQCCPENYLIEPMLLIPFVENAFKHGTTLIKDAEIDINLRVINQVLCFFISNKFNKDSDGIKDSSTGIGLANVKRRLTLLYGDHYQLQIITLGDWHTVSLQLNLN